MDAYETGYAFGRLMATLACLLVPLAVVGGAIWFAVARSRRRSRSLQPQAPYGAPPSYPLPGGPPYPGQSYPGPGGPPSYPAPQQPYPPQQYPLQQPNRPQQPYPPQGSGR